MKLNEIEISPYLLKELKNPPVWTEEEKKIIAWSICWEGSICLIKSKHTSSSQGFKMLPEVALSNTNVKLLEHFQKIVKLGKIGKAVRVNRPKAKNVYHWHIQSLEECAYLLFKILPYLQSKQKQAYYTIQYINSRLSVRKSTYHKYTTFEIECQKKVSLLNRKGSQNGET
jgi:hypothetical protein